MAKYFGPSVREWGFMLVDGTDLSGLEIEDPYINDHASLAWRAGFKGWKGALSSGAIRYAYDPETEELFVEYVEGAPDLDRRIAKLRRLLTDARHVIKDVRDWKISKIML